MSFEDREKAIERKFERDQEHAFKLRAKKRQLLAKWAAGQLGLKGKAEKAYIDEMVALGLHRGGDAEEIEHIARDFKAKGIAIDEHRIRLEAEHCEREAKKQLGGPT
jgi:hypothetical protein